MIETIFKLTGIDKINFNLDDNVLFVVCGLLLLFCLGYFFNFFQILMERLTAKRR